MGIARGWLKAPPCEAISPKFYEKRARGDILYTCLAILQKKQVLRVIVVIGEMTKAELDEVGRRSRAAVLPPGIRSEINS